MKIGRFLTALLLLPLCFAITHAGIIMLMSLHVADDALFPPSVLALGGGFLLWLVLYMTLPRPALSYVLAHELTHALWGSLMGEKVLGMNVSSTRGSVTLSDSNFLITLAPYFFPLYTLIVILGYYVLGAFFDVQQYELGWMALVGFTWAFHCTFTASSLMQRQTDIQECGYLFSYVIIYLFNFLGMVLWIIIVTPATLEQFVVTSGTCTATAATAAWKWICMAIEKIPQFFSS